MVLSENSAHPLDYEAEKASRSLDYAQVIRWWHILDKVSLIKFKESEKSPEMRSVVTELGFRESNLMLELKEKLRKAGDFETAKGLFIEYRTEAENYVDAIHFSKVGRALAQATMGLAMAALYLENNKSEDLGEYFDEELSDVNLLISNLWQGIT